MKIIKLLTVTGLVSVIAAGSAFSVLASDDIESAENELAATQQDLDDLRASIDDLEEQKEALTGEIDGLQSQLVTTISGVEALAGQIDELTAQMELTEVDLANAEDEKDVQYEAMKKRIQYLYETGGEAGWAAVFLAGGNISDILDKAEYTQQMYDYDRQQLEEYLASIDKVEALQQQQRNERSELETRKREQEEGQTKLESLLAEAEEEYDDYDEELEEAYAKAEEYQALITEQNDVIAQLIAAQEAMGVNTDDAAVVAQQIVDSYYSDAGAGYAGGDTASASEIISQISESGYSSATGAAILAYAQQFLGNSYVYGGNSLTDGVDCSGFVQQVYANFGINTSRTSWDIESDGQAVSYNDLQLGDVLCYDGHVGIYAGNGQIINAIDEEHGIGYSDADYHEIRTIRRYVDDAGTDAGAEGGGE